MSRRRPEVVAAVLLLMAAVLTGCTTSGPPGDGDGDGDPWSSPCAVTEIVIDPESVDAGGTLVVAGAATGCDPGIEYALTLQGDEAGALSFTAVADADGAFTAETTIPADFPAGEGVVTVTKPFPPCADNGACAAVSAAVQINAAP